MDARELLNFDCWEEVLGWVTNPRDLKSCSEANTLFQDVLQLRLQLAEYKFYQILPFLMKYLHTLPLVPSKPYFRWLAEKRWNPGEHWKDLLRCREVCRAWSSSIKNYLEENPDPESYPKSVLPVDNPFHFFQDTTKFINAYRNFNGDNPFLGRNITLYTLVQFQANWEGETRNDREHRLHMVIAHRNGFFPNLYEILEQYGQEIWYAVLKDTEDYYSSSEFLQALQRILGLLPNLRQLDIRARINSDLMREIVDSHDEDTHLFYITLESAQQLRAGAPTPPPWFTTQAETDEWNLHASTASFLPPLQQLTHFKADKFDEREEFLLQQYGRQLKYVNLKEGDTLTGTHLTNLTFLRELKVDAVIYHNSMNVLKTLQSPLEKLSLALTQDLLNTRADFFTATRRQSELAQQAQNGQGDNERSHKIKYSDDEDVYPFWIDKLLQNVKHLPLKHLCLMDSLSSHNNCAIAIAESGPVLEEPLNESITRLSVTSKALKVYLSFNYLPLMKNLEEIDLHFDSGIMMEHPHHLEEIIKVHSFWKKENLKESNVWEEVSSLKKITVDLKKKMLTSYRRK